MLKNQNQKSGSEVNPEGELSIYGAALHPQNVSAECYLCLMLHSTACLERKLYEQE